LLILAVHGWAHAQQSRGIVTDLLPLASQSTEGMCPYSPALCRYPEADNDTLGYSPKPSTQDADQYLLQLPLQVPADPRPLPSLPIAQPSLAGIRVPYCEAPDRWDETTEGAWAAHIKYEECLRAALETVKDELIGTGQLR
ncbi:MAG: hypothetical protein ACREEI_12280, partial [Stellaceae bacterium]